MSTRVFGVLSRVLTGLTLSVLLLNLALGIAPNLDTRLVQWGELLWPGYAAELRVEHNEPTCSATALEQQLQNCSPEAKTQPVDEDPFAETTAEHQPVDCAALKTMHDVCADKHASYRKNIERLTPTVQAFRKLEHSLSAVASFDYWKHLLVILVLLGALAATGRRMHIALRSPTSRMEQVVSESAMLIAHGLLFLSSLADASVQRSSTAEIENAALPYLWGAGFLALAAINSWHLFHPPPNLNQQPRLGRAFMAIPLFAYMVISAGMYFLAIEHHPSGLAIYLHKFVQHPSIYLGIGLYVWAGMAFAQTTLAPTAFDILRPWNLPPHLLGWLVAVVSALPVAYSGASGIFVLATGGVVFERLRASGASRRMALGATAMSGSLGVVLRPCLIVVLVAVLNKQVTTDLLFERGFQVFLLTASLYFIAMWVRKDRPLRLPPVKAAAKQSLSEAKRLILPALISASVVLVYRFFLQMNLNEHNAPLILPVVLLAVLLVDRRTEKPLTRITKATTESSHQLGALLMVMACSVAFGGIVERSEVMELVPQQLGSPTLAMAMLVVVMIIVGMTMDPLGAVILVSVTLAPVAAHNGIDPVHFWMMVLVAFELGYLTPPVALNMLLARQVVGAEAEIENEPVEGGFVTRYEHVVIPVAVMGTALVLVAFGPLFFY